MGSEDMPQRHRAGTVYGSGLRRCLIIFDPHALILDRRTHACRTPSPLVLLQRSENFTSGVAIAFTSSGSIIGGWNCPMTAFIGRAFEELTGTEPHCLNWAPRPAQLYCHIESVLCHSLDEHSAKVGCLEHTEFSRVTAMVDSSW